MIRTASAVRRRARVRQASILAFLAVMGPGVITGFAGNEAGGVTTYSAVGARFGYSMLWLLLVASVGLGVVQETTSRMGLTTGQGLSDLIRERFGVRWTIVAMVALLVANGSNVIAEFAGIAAGLEILRVPREVSVPVAATLVWALVVFSSYRVIERALFVLLLAFLAYPVSVAILRPDLGQVLTGFIPTLPSDPSALAFAVALVGTTITPYLLFYIQASVVDKGLDRRSMGYARVDVLMGAALAGLFAFLIIVVTATVLHPAGVQVTSAEDAAKALAPLAGQYAGLLFAVGLTGASLLGAVVMPLSTSYAICEAFGWESGISKNFREAPVFMSLFTLLLLVGGLVVLTPGLSLIPLIVAAQVANGVLLPVMLVFIMRLATDRRVMGDLVSGRVATALGWGTVLVAGTLSVAYVALALLGIA
ncbi:MAG: Nramp family divalent metal transporter [Chloroflexota bacterium]|nr:Nramp family divalent metal transporter [Chloroflexota bacterium]